MDQFQLSYDGDDNYGDYLINSAAGNITSIFI